MSNRTGVIGFYINQHDCMGCRTCQLACKDKNDLPVGILFRHVKSFEAGVFPAPGVYHYPGTCNHCISAACVLHCPTGAMYKADDGTTQHDDEICIGCKKCMESCPYEVPQFFEDTKITGKCNFCIDLRNAGGSPACVDACRNRCLEWGEYDELLAAHPEAIQDIAVLPDSSITLPNTLISARISALDGDFREQVN
jgi:anaerobic dimethyl sulfoxide reductase subunit B (iron-sulfur subunit)